jgi:hypothetical protein
VGIQYEPETKWQSMGKEIAVQSPTPDFFGPAIAGMSRTQAVLIITKLTCRRHCEECRGVGKHCMQHMQLVINRQPAVGGFVPDLNLLLCTLYQQPLFQRAKKAIAATLELAAQNRQMHVCQLGLSNVEGQLNHVLGRMQYSDDFCACSFPRFTDRNRGGGSAPIDNLWLAQRKVPRDIRTRVKLGFHKVMWSSGVDVRWARMLQAPFIGAAVGAEAEPREQEYWRPWASCPGPGVSVLATLAEATV